MRLLLDENLETEVYHRLTDRGHDVLHVTVSEGLAGGMSDDEIAAVSSDEHRVIVTYDDDFCDAMSESAYCAVLYIESQDLSAGQVADIIHGVSEYYDAITLSGFRTVGRNWL